MVTHHSNSNDTNLLQKDLQQQANDYTTVLQIYQNKLWLEYIKNTKYKQNSNSKIPTSTKETDELKINNDRKKI